jgi:hypothetical protein
MNWHVKSKHPRDGGALAAGGTVPSLGRDTWAAQNAA